MQRFFKLFFFLSEYKGRACTLRKAWKVLKKKHEEMLAVALCFCRGMGGSWAEDHQSVRGSEYHRACKEETSWGDHEQLEETPRCLAWVECLGLPRAALDATLSAFPEVGPLNLRAFILPSEVRSELEGAQSRGNTTPRSSFLGSPLQSAFSPFSKSILSR